MSNVIEAEEVKPGQALAVVKHQNQAVGILRPADSLDHIAEAFKEYQTVCERILTKDDYQNYDGKDRKKKSAWRKLATAFNVSTEVVDKEIERHSSGHVTSALFTIRASTPTREMQATGYCDIFEKCCPGASGGICHKKGWRNHKCCASGCDGRRHWSHPNHDVISTAQTRATNRAVADLIGCGEVSAEELGEDAEPTKEPGEQKPAPATNPNPPPPPSPKPKPETAIPPADEKTLARMIDGLKDCRQLATEYFCKLTEPSVLMPNETLEQIPLRFVPRTTREYKALVKAIGDFGNGEPPRHYLTQASSATEQAPAPPAPAPTLAPTPSKSVMAARAKDPEWWRDVIVPVPRKGQRRDEYLQAPDTIGSLYEATKGGDQEAQRRLFGFANHFQPKPWQGRDGKSHPPGQADVDFREALDSFLEWEQKHKTDTDATEDDNVAF